MPSVYFIHHIQHLADGCSYGICLGYEFFIIADMTVEVVKEFLRNIKTYFWHVLTFFKKMNYIELIGFNALATTFRDYSKNVTEEENKERKKQKSDTLYYNFNASRKGVEPLAYGLRVRRSAWLSYRPALNN